MDKSKICFITLVVERLLSRFHLLLLEGVQLFHETTTENVLEVLLTVVIPRQFIEFLLYFHGVEQYGTMSNLQKFTYAALSSELWKTHQYYLF
jgi:hypothetical protein